MSVRLEPTDMERHRRELRRLTDLELVLDGQSLRGLVENEKTIVSPFRESPSVWELHMEDAIAEWHARRNARRVGEGICLCHVPGTQAITARAQTWRASGWDYILSTSLERRR